jgi:hypothetical protein
MGVDDLVRNTNAIILLGDWLKKDDDKKRVAKIAALFYCSQVELNVSFFLGVL